MRTIIAIDGPAASGKSTVAHELAARLFYAHVNSGAFYRAFTWWVLRAKADPTSVEEAAAVLERTKLSSRFEGNEGILLLDDVDPTPHVRDDAVTHAVSFIARMLPVREALTTHLRSLAEERDLVMEGRDIGSFVFPDTPYKFYIDASPEVRRARRQAQGHHDEIATRDRIDSSRAYAPLTIAEDAHMIDSTHLTIDGVVGEVIGLLKLLGLSMPAR